ncbi:MAG: metallophosphoesterase family protein [Planctomycetota bacterium]
MLGRPRDGGVHVWIRSSDPTEFVVRYGTDPDHLETQSPSGMTRIAHDNTGVVAIDGLQPDRRYHYQVFIGDRPHGLPGSFRTLPSAKQLVGAEYNPDGLFNFRFQIGSCANQNPLHGNGHRATTYEHLNADWADKVHFHIMNGDWLYEELRDYPAEAWRLTQGLEQVPAVVDVAPSIVGVWENYKLYLSRGNELSRWHRHVPSVFTFDDHELVNDIWGSAETGKRHRRTVFRDIGTRAWFDYLGWANPIAAPQRIHLSRCSMKRGSDILIDQETDFTKLPIDQLTNLHVHWGTPQAGINDMRFDDDRGHPNSAVYDVMRVLGPHRIQLDRQAPADGDSLAYSIGRRSYGKFRVANCEFYLLDTRGIRDMHDVTDRDKPGVSMIGQRQREWLLESMRRSEADFFFVVSTVPFMIPHSGAGGFEADAGNKEEAWTGFLDEREMLIRQWSKLDKKVFVMTGDLHNSFAIRVTDDIWEFCCGPHNSVNHVPKLDESDRPATGRWSFGGREMDIRWSSYILPDVPRLERLYPHFCVVQVNNVFNMPRRLGDTRAVAYPHPQVVFQYYDGRSGELAYAESISLKRESPAVPQRPRARDQ